MDALLDLPQLRTFHVLAQTGSFTACARRLHRTQSAISHAMAKLEAQVGAPLLRRRSRGLGLTEEGQRLFEACERAFATIDAAADDLRRGRPGGRGRLRLGATVEFGSSILMKHMGPFLAAHPHMDLAFTLSLDLLPPLLRDDLDLILDCHEHPHPGLLQVPLFRETYVVACSPAFQKAHRLAAPEDLARCPVLSLDPAGAWWHRVLGALPEARRPRLTRLVPINHVRAMIHAGAEGLGVLLAPHYAVLEELRRGDLVALFPGLQPSEDRFSLYVKQVKADQASIRAFTDYMKGLSPAEFGS